jgi:hypothetical protein
MSSAARGYIGDGATAIHHAEMGVRLSPLDERLSWHEGLLARAHWIDGSYEEALDWIRSAVERNESARFNLRTLIGPSPRSGESMRRRTWRSSCCASSRTFGSANMRVAAHSWSRRSAFA